MDVDTIFKALANPSRRRILALLAQSDLSVGELTAEFSVSQPAVSQHLRELEAAHLVAATRMGVERRYHLIGAPIRHVYEWAAAYRPFFDPAGHAWSLQSSPMPKKVQKRGSAGGR